MRGGWLEERKEPVEGTEGRSRRGGCEGQSWAESMAIILPHKNVFMLAEEAIDRVKALRTWTH